MLKNLTISRKLTWLNALVSAAALMLACMAFLAYDQVTYKQTLFHNLSSEAQVVGFNSISALVFNDPDSATTTLSALRASPSILAATIFTGNGRVFATYAQNQKYQITEESPPAAGQTETYVVTGNQVLLTRSIAFGRKPMGFIVIRGSLQELDDRLWQYLQIAAGVLIFSLGAALILSSFVRRAVAEPIVRLAQTARIVSRDKNYAIRVEPTGNRDETAVLIEAFNDMLAQIHVRDAALGIERARLKVIIENAPAGIVLASAPSGEIILMNRRAEEILGHPMYPAADIGSYAQYHTLHADGRTLQTNEHPLARAVMQGEVIRSEEYRYVRPDGKETWIRSSAAPILDKQNNIVAGVLVFSDIDEQKQAQEALLRSEKLAAAGRLAASISHEINNPLESITNLLYLALSDARLAADTREYLNQAEQELARVSQITTQTLRFYRQTTNPTSADIGSLLDSVLRLLRGRVANTEVKVVTEYRATRPLHCFEGELRQVFTNLIGNALDAMTGHPGRLVVRTSESHNWATGEAGIRVTVADSGSGINRDTLQRIFEPFYTTKGLRGTGLGLWVSKEIIAKHRGTMRVKSTVGTGTTFSVFLPFQVADERRNNAAGSASA
jgi:PAS domain S-box-containing protein